MKNGNARDVRNVRFMQQVASVSSTLLLCGRSTACWRVIVDLSVTMLITYQLAHYYLLRDSDIAPRAEKNLLVL